MNRLTKKIKKQILGFAVILFCSSVSFASEIAGDSSSNDSIIDTDSTLKIKQHADYSDAGADTCLKCHDDESENPATLIFKSSHAVKADKRTPFGQLECESCHGPAGKHSVRRVRKGKLREPMISFESASGIPVAQRNDICSSCHQKKQKSHWQGSIHQINDVACTDCHKIHTDKDPVQEVKSQQVEICGSCHQSQKLAANRFSTHPLKYENQMGCSDCHSLHGPENDHMLSAESTNDTCFQCHAEKRGPFAWEHEPASEDCSLCHLPHGSNQQAMLVQKAPFLCQSCHSSDGHPSIVQDSSGINSGSSTFLLGRSCSNCHSQVHGSNHPSGSRLQR